MIGRKFQSMSCTSSMVRQSVAIPRVREQSRKAKEKNIDVGFEAKEINLHEKRLLAKLLEFPEVVEKCHKELRLHYLCDYAFKLATLFNEFYNACPVIGAGDEKIMKFRLAIVKAVATVLKTIFSILGIVALERM